jgi:hypothetical protein
MDHTGQTVSLFDDNVQMSGVYKFYLETSCVETAHGEECTYVEISDPDFNHHTFDVGVSKIKIQGFDIAGNKHECITTLFVHDEEPPVFLTPPSEASTTLYQHVSNESCTVKNGAPFIAYEGLSWESSATDNCDQDVEIVKSITDLEGNVLYDSSTDDPMGDFSLGPGAYKMIYKAVDDYSFDMPEPLGGSTLDTTWTVDLILDDVARPYEISHCPDDIEVLIEPHELETHLGRVNWTIPNVTGDNCLSMLPPPPPEEINGTVPGSIFPVGTTLVQYIFKDGADPPNVYPEECKFTVTVVQKENPVEITCPEDINVETLELSNFAIVRWETPPAKQGNEVLTVTYPSGVASGMPFPFGVTEVKAKAVGTLPAGQNGDPPFAECFFTVTVTDNEHPKCDSREYSCVEGSQEDAIRPYQICEGPLLDTSKKPGYETTFEYEILGVTQEPDYPMAGCCSNGKGVPHVCDLDLYGHTTGTQTRVCVPFDDFGGES